MDLVQGDGRVFLGRAEEVREHVDQEPHGIRIDVIAEHRTAAAIFDLNAEQIIVHAVPTDEHVVALADVQRGIKPGVHHLIVCQDAVARQDGEQTVNLIAIRDIADEGEAIDAGGYPLKAGQLGVGQVR